MAIFQQFSREYWGGGAKFDFALHLRHIGGCLLAHLNSTLNPPPRTSFCYQSPQGADIGGGANAPIPDLGGGGNRSPII